ncbi:MAG: type II toxin-antitoxin system Phd/YefM family antitoxin [Cyanobacteria bacterium J06621_11]
MSIHPVEEAQNNFRKIMAEVAESHKPIIVTSEGSNVVVLAEEDWTSIQETLYLLSVPGMRETIKEGLTTSLDDCSAEIEW